jgi:ATP-dependent Clp protease ATP-binding subunit ClpC
MRRIISLLIAHFAALLRFLVTKCGTPATISVDISCLKYTELAEQILAMACEEARWHGHSWVGTEHVLHALIRHEQSGVSEAFLSLGVNPGTIRQELEQLMPGCANPVAATDLGRTASLEKALRFAAEQAEDGPIDPVHLLVGLLRARGSVASHVLEYSGVLLK